jgi:hypothetical protein
VQELTACDGVELRLVRPALAGKWSATTASAQRRARRRCEHCGVSHLNACQSGMERGWDTSMHTTSDGCNGCDRGAVSASARRALVRAIRTGERGCAEETRRREERRAFARVRADRALGGVTLEDVVRALRSAWDEVYGPTCTIPGRRLAYYRLVSRCLASCVRPDSVASDGDSRESGDRLRARHLDANAAHSTRGSETRE